MLYTTRTLNLPKYWTYHFRRCVSNYWENFGQKKTRCRQRRRHSCWCIFRGSCLCLKKRFMRQIRPFGTRTLNKFVLLFVNISQTRKLSMLNKFSKTKWCVYWSQIWDMILDASMSLHYLIFASEANFHRHTELPLSVVLYTYVFLFNQPYLLKGTNCIRTYYWGFS